MESPATIASSSGMAVTMGPISAIIAFIVWGLLGLVIYFIPSIVANKKQHHQKTSILILNIFLGWTFFGWVAALIWATLQDKKS